MSFGNLWTNVTEEQAKRVQSEFFMDMLLMFISVTILMVLKHYDPKGCGIPLREWLIVFFVLYFSRSTY
jgi:hypothetical protein